MGTKRITVKQFRKMDDGAAYAVWRDGHWPFDWASCDHCLTQHFNGDCGMIAHKELHESLREVFVVRPLGGEELKANAAKLFALRKKFNHLYAASPSEVSNGK